MTGHIDRALALYERGVITVTELSLQVIEATVQRPTGDLVARLPSKAVEAIREQAARPPGAELRSFGVGWFPEECKVQPVALAFWREYFDSLTEPNQ